MLKLSQKTLGFSIVELLVVIVIIGIIATISVGSYDAYRKNAQDAQIASTISAYQDAVSTMKSEQKLIPDNYDDTGYAELMSCPSSANDTTICCILFVVDVGGLPSYGCADNTYHADFGAGTNHFTGGVWVANLGYNSSQLSSWTRKYLPSTPPQLPQLSPSVPNCVFGSYQHTAYACSTQQIGLQTFIYPDGTHKSYLHYNLPADRDCQSKDVVTVSTSPGPPGGLPYERPSVSYTNAKYTSRVTTGSTPFTFCVVGVR